MKFLDQIRNNETVYAIARSFFTVGSISFLVIILFEVVFPGYFTNWFNPIWCLIIVVISGILTIANEHYD